MKRTEDQIVTRAPIVVILGGTKYEIAPLVIRDSRVWRAKIVKLMAALPELVSITTDDAKGFAGTLTKILVTNPDETLDLFFEYAKDLDREMIESTTTDAEMAVAFEELVKIVFPLAESLPKALARLSQ